jgi:hypothetical protein
MKNTLLLLTFLAGAESVMANLITNGDFETLDSRVGLVNGRRLNNLTPSRWDVYGSLPGWSTLSGRGIEVQATGVVVSAHSGNHYIELDSHPNGSLSGSTNSAMYQDVLLGTGQYELSFFYRPRTNSLNDNGISLLLNNINVLSVDNTSGKQNAWAQFSTQFTVLTQGVQRITFAAGGNANQLGGFLDTISLTKQSEITAQTPEPASLALMGAALTGLALLRRRS